MQFIAVRKFTPLAVALGLLLCSADSLSQVKPKFDSATMVVGFAPGGSADGTVRIIASNVSEATGITMVVSNKPGAGGILAHQNLMSGPKDGSQIMMTSVGPLTVLPHMSSVGYDVGTDFIPVTLAVDFPNILVVPASSGVKTFDDFIKYAKDNPGAVNFGSSGIGSASHMGGSF